MKKYKRYLMPFYSVYLENSYLDPHAKFADLLKIDRQEAKRLAYEMAYSFTDSDFFKVVRGELEIIVTKEYL